jgi:alpha-glucosidase
MSIAAFSPLYRAHSMINTNDAEPWAFGEEVEEISRNYMKLRYRLLPTIYSAFYEATQSGLPLVSSLAIDYPNDENIYSSAFQNQYLFCNRFLVAPVESYKEITKIYLPEGQWYYLYSDQLAEGENTIYQDTPINYLPVYVKAGSVFSMQSDVFSTSESHDGTLRIHVYYGDNGSSYLHYEDDGISHDYQSGNYLKREITYFPGENQLVFGKTEGSYASDFSKLRIFFHGFKSQNFEVNGLEKQSGKTDFAFLSKLTEFDPLPENDHPHYKINDLNFLEIENSSEKIVIDLLS